MPMKDKKYVLYIASLTSKVVLIFSATLMAIYLILPLFGGKLFFNAVVKCAGWVAIALGVIAVVNRSSKKIQIRGREYLLLGFAVIFNLIVWFPYPVDIILCLISVIVFLVSYRYQSPENRNRQNLGRHS